MPARRRKRQSKQLATANFQGTAPVMSLAPNIPATTGHVARDVGARARGRGNVKAAFVSPTVHTPGLDMQFLSSIGLDNRQLAQALDWYKEIY